MDDIMELTELDFDSNSNFGGPQTKSTNFGGGLELLMNDKVKESNRPTSDINLDDLNNLENELNNLVDDVPTDSFRPKSDFFSRPSVSFEDQSSSSRDDINLGKST